MNFFRANSDQDLDVEAQICRPDQNYVPPPSPDRFQRRIGQDNSKIFIERNQFLINGKPINSLDQMRQTLTQCPESYLNFMKVTGSTGQNFSNGISYEDFRLGYRCNDYLILLDSSKSI